MGKYGVISLFCILVFGFGCGWQGETSSNKAKVSKGQSLSIGEGQFYPEQDYDRFTRCHLQLSTSRSVKIDPYLKFLSRSMDNLLANYSLVDVKKSNLTKILYNKMDEVLALCEALVTPDTIPNYNEQGFYLRTLLKANNINILRQSAKEPLADVILVDGDNKSSSLSSAKEISYFNRKFDTAKTNFCSSKSNKYVKGTLGGDSGGKIKADPKVDFIAPGAQHEHLYLVHQLQAVTSWMFTALADTLYAAKIATNKSSQANVNEVIDLLKKDFTGNGEFSAQQCRVVRYLPGTFQNENKNFFKPAEHLNDSKFVEVLRLAFTSQVEAFRAKGVFQSDFPNNASLGRYYDMRILFKDVFDLVCGNGLYKKSGGKFQITVNNKFTESEVLDNFQQNGIYFAIDKFFLQLVEASPYLEVFSLYNRGRGFTNKFSIKFEEILDRYYAINSVENSYAGLLYPESACLAADTAEEDEFKVGNIKMYQLGHMLEDGDAIAALVGSFGAVAFNLVADVLSLGMDISYAINRANRACIKAEFSNLSHEINPTYEARVQATNDSYTCNERQPQVMAIAGLGSLITVLPVSYGVLRHGFKSTIEQLTPKFLNKLSSRWVDGSLRGGALAKFMQVQMDTLDNTNLSKVLSANTGSSSKSFTGFLSSINDILDGFHLKISDSDLARWVRHKRAYDIGQPGAVMDDVFAESEEGGRLWVKAITECMDGGNCGNTPEERAANSLRKVGVGDEQIDEVNQMCY